MNLYQGKDSTYHNKFIKGMPVSLIEKFEF